MRCDVSVIVPLYNAKDLVKFTADSVLNQTCRNIELLIVDDCSTDGSLDLCRELYGHDERVRIIQQPKNMGPGAARNAGIRSATGDYVTFWDSDDEALPDTLSNMLDTAQKFGADVVHNTQVLYPIPDEDGNMPLQMAADGVDLFRNDTDRDAYTEVTLLGDDMSSRLEDWKKGRIHWSVWNKLYSRKFLVDNGIYFSDMKVAEDMVFCFECLFKAKNYVIVPGGGYIYRLISSSLSRGKKSSANVVTALKAQVGAVSSMSRILREVPFFVEHPEQAVSALGRVLDDIEIGYIRPAYQVLGEETLRSDNLVHEFMTGEFSDKAPYVEFLFYELHRIYAPVVDYIAQLGDIETLKALAKTYHENKRKNKQ